VRLGLVPGATRAPDVGAEVWLTALVSLGLHLLRHPAYGFHRDEMLYLAMGDHLDLLRMQFPPMIAILAQAARALPLDLLTAIRLLAALASAALPILTAIICRELGGSRRAQFLTALAVLVALLFLRTGGLFQPVVFEQLWCCLTTLAVVELLAGWNRRWWLVAGAGVGMSALTKFSLVFLGAGLLVAMAFSPLRHDLRTRWPWLGAALVGILALPSLTGQITWGWPFFAQARALQATQLGHFDRLGFLLGQFLMLGPGGPLWLVGLMALLTTRTLRLFRPVGVLALTVFLLLLATHGKDYYFGSLHPPLIAAAATMIGGWLEGRRRVPVFAGALAFLVLGGSALLPMGVPLLPPEPMARYAAALGVTRATRTNYSRTLPLPQDFADMTGWREQVATVGTVFRALSPQDQARAAILGNNYGRTAAVALFGRQFGLPYPISLHGDFYHWGTGERSGEVTIIIGGTAKQWRENWGEVSEAARTRNPWGVDEEQSVPIFICRRPRLDLPSLFRRLGPDWAEGSIGQRNS
jgi:4-amino-4-deoxy-L-arabinose transferase-like glycosyltransferase